MFIYFTLKCFIPATDTRFHERIVQTLLPYACAPRQVGMIEHHIGGHEFETRRAEEACHPVLTKHILYDEKFPAGTIQVVTTTEQCFVTVTRYQISKSSIQGGTIVEPLVQRLAYCPTIAATCQHFI